MEKEQENSYHKINLKWDNTANAKNSISVQK